MPNQKTKKVTLIKVYKPKDYFICLELGCSLKTRFGFILL